ncbi:MAG: hypothetical protein GY783_16825, partial [Gammaproteobacteria bacterium]|nr:hypothetical protein [Gammaproteobacteria bacterium]
MLTRLLLVVAVIAPSLSAEALAQSETDTKLWTGFTGEIELTRQARVDIEQELRLDQSLAGFEKTFTNIGLRYRLNKYLRLSGNYRFIVTEDDVNETIVQHRVAGDADLRYR